MDNITVYVQVKCEDFQEQEISPRGKAAPYTRRRYQKIYESSGGNVRVRRVKSGAGIVIEGSFIRFLQGHNVICPLGIQNIVMTTVDRVLRALGITPTPEEQKRIERGRIKLDRLDVVAWIKTVHLGSVGQVLTVLDYGLAGSASSRLVVPGQTIVWHAFSKYWSLMFYDKAQQMRSVYPDDWAALSDAVRRVAEDYVRVELRVLRKGLHELGWMEVRDVTDDGMRQEVIKRVAEAFADLRTPVAPIPATETKLSRAKLVALLKVFSVDVSSGLGTRARRYVERQMREELGVSHRQFGGLPLAYRRQIVELQEPPAMPLRFGIPRRLRGLSQVTQV